MSTKPPLPPPMKISPLIKVSIIFIITIPSHHKYCFFLLQLCRWVFLIWGAKYGIERQSFLSEREVTIEEEKRRKKEERDAKLCEERRIQSEKDIEDLASLAEPPKKVEPNPCDRNEIINLQNPD